MAKFTCEHQILTKKINLYKDQISSLLKELINQGTKMLYNEKSIYNKFYVNDRWYEIILMNVWFLFSKLAENQSIELQWCVQEVCRYIEITTEWVENEETKTMGKCLTNWLRLQYRTWKKALVSAKANILTREKFPINSKIESWNGYSFDTQYK